MAGDIRNLTGQPTGGVRQFERGSVPGQPTRIRTWGIPTGPGWFDRAGKWNFVEPYSAEVYRVLEDLLRRVLRR